MLQLGEPCKKAKKETPEELAEVKGRPRQDRVHLIAELAAEEVPLEPVIVFRVPDDGLDRGSSPEEVLKARCESRSPADQHLLAFWVVRFSSIPFVDEDFLDVDSGQALYLIDRRF